MKTFRHTEYSLHILDLATRQHIDDGEEFIRQFRKEDVTASKAFDDDGVSLGYFTWEDPVSALAAFSINHPGLLFELNIQGGEDYQQMAIYATAGKTQAVSLVRYMPEFNPDLLA